MSQSSHTSSSSDSQLIHAIVQNIKSRGVFDEFRRECLSDADTKPSFQNLLQRVEGYVWKFLCQQRWTQNRSKNFVRETLRTHLNESPMLKHGIEHLVEQVVNYKINSLFWPKIESVVKEFMGIQEIGSNASNATNAHNSMQFNDNSMKTNSKNSSKTNEMIETKAIVIKSEPKEQTVGDTSQPMDIESDSNNSLNNRNKVKKENENDLSFAESDNRYIDWPTPPQPEMLTPERPELTYSPIDTKDSNKSSDDSNSVSNVKKEENLLSTEIKENETFLLNKQLMDELKDQKTIEPKEDKSGREGKDGSKENDEDLSDVSSVHTSDLSDFDDEISVDDSNDEREDSKKKRISLKVVKKITEVLSNQQIVDKESERSDKIEPKVEKQSNSEEENNEKSYESIVKSETKRIRRINPKYSSKEFSSIFTGKDRSLAGTSREGLDESTGEQTKSSKAESDQRLSSRRRRHSNDSDIDNRELNSLSSNRSSKAVKREDMALDSRSSSRGSVESSMSETTQDSNQSQNKSNKRKINKNRNESQTQRYEASDLYKPRHVFSSRRTRGPTTPDSSTQSNDDFFIHDLSKQ